jgi:hypothetical protein
VPDELDTILDQAIQSYSAVEPSPDLAGRILQQAQQVPAPRRNRLGLTLAFAVPLAAALGLAFVLAGQWALPKPPAAVASLPSTPDIAAYTHSQLTETLAAAPREPVPRGTYARKIRTARSTARSLPAPYTKEELALLAFVEQHPKEAAEIAKAQEKEALAPPQPITISHLEIKPLTIPPLN